MDCTAAVEAATPTAVNGATTVDARPPIAVGAAAVTVHGPASIAIVAGPAVIAAVAIRPAASIRTAVEARPAAACGFGSADADPALLEGSYPEKDHERGGTKRHQS